MTLIEFLEILFSLVYITCFVFNPEETCLYYSWLYTLSTTAPAVTVGKLTPWQGGLKVELLHLGIHIVERLDEFKQL